MERELGAVYRCITCQMSLDGEEAQKEHEKKGHKVKKTKIFIVPPSSNGSGGFNIKCIVAGAPSVSAPQGARNVGPAPPNNMLVMTNDGQIVRRRVQTLQGQLIGAPPQVAARMGGSRPVFFLSSGQPGGHPGGRPGAQPGGQPGGQQGGQPGGRPGAQPGGQPGAQLGGQPGPRVPPQQVPVAIDEQIVETTVERNQEEETAEREAGVQQEGAVEQQQVNEAPPQAAGSSQANLEQLLTGPQLEYIRNPTQRPGVGRARGGKAVDPKRILGPVRSNPLGGNRGGRRNFS